MPFKRALRRVFNDETTHDEYDFTVTLLKLKIESSSIIINYNLYLKLIIIINDLYLKLYQIISIKDLYLKLMK